MLLQKTIVTIVIFFIVSISLFAQDVNDNSEETITLPFEDIYKAKQENKETENVNSVGNPFFPMEEDKRGTNKKLLPNMEDKTGIQEVVPGDEKAELPNLTNPEESKKFKGTDDGSKSAFEKGSYQLNSHFPQDAQNEFQKAASGQGEYSTKAKFSQIRSLARANKKDDAMMIINSLDPENRYKGLFELASGLDGVNPKPEEFNHNATFDQMENEEKKKVWWEKDSVRNSKKDAISTYLTIITEADDKETLAKAHWGVANLLYKISEYKSALDHLSKIIFNYNQTKFIDDAIYLSAKIYESEGNARDLGNAQKYYDIFMKNVEMNNRNFQESIYLPEVKSRMEKIKNNSF